MGIAHAHDSCTHCVRIGVSQDPKNIKSNSSEEHLSSIKRKSGPRLSCDWRL